MKAGFVDGLFCGILIMLIVSALVGVFAGEQPRKQVDRQGDCCADFDVVAGRLGYLKSAIVLAVNESMRGKHKHAQDAALDGLRRAGFNCTTIPDPKDSRGQFLCE